MVFGMFFLDYNFVPVFFVQPKKLKKALKAKKNIGLKHKSSIQN